MLAFHSNWTKPFFLERKEPYFIEDFELLTTILSALEWRENNGNIKMVTDEIGAAYYKSLGLEELWDLGIECCLDDMDKEINPRIFWAAGKLYALKLQEEPCVMLDTDFIVWKRLVDHLEDEQLVVIHREALEPSVYPPKEKLLMSKEYTFNKKWDWQEEACNTAFMYIGTEKLKQDYVQESIKFMKAAIGEDPISYMVFAEQRLLALCAKEMNVPITSLSNLKMLFNERQSYFTHIWGHKSFLRSHLEERILFCKKCLRRIELDFPEYYEITMKTGCFDSYLE